MEKLGKLDNKELKTIKNWTANQHLSKLTQSSVAPKRTEKWYRIGSNLKSINTGQDKLFLCPDPNKIITSIGDRYLPFWDSVAVCGGNTNIKWHRDHGHFKSYAVMVNLGEALFSEKLNKKSPPSVYHLTDGDIVKFDSKIFHQAEQLSERRFNIIFRQIRPEFLWRLKTLGE